MGWFARLANHLRPQLDREIDEELEFHVAERTRELIAEGRQPDEARRDAIRRLGNRLTLRERVRDTNVVVAVEQILQDLRNAVRSFLKDRGVSAIAILSIALGTGANVAIFSVADVMLLRPQPIARADDVLVIGAKRHYPGGGEDILTSYPEYLDLRARSRTLSEVMAHRYEQVGFGKAAATPAQIRVASFVSDNFFSVLGLMLPLGRPFTVAESSRADPQPVVILSHALWRSEFNADPSVIGTSARIAGRAFTIIGVAPESFTGLHSFIRESVFLPIGMLPRVIDVARSNVLEARDAQMFNVRGRLVPGQTKRDVQTELDAISQELQREHPEPDAHRPMLAETDFRFRFGLSRLVSSTLVLTTLLSIGVLLVACANVASLLAGKAPARAREMAVRLAVGASRARLLRQLMTESLALAAVGAIAGLVVARVGIGLLRGIQFSSEVISPPDLQLDERALAFSIAIAVGTAFIAGLVPALQVTRVDLVTALKAGDRASTDDAGRGRRVLVAVQLALAVVLVTVSAVTFRFFHSEVGAGPGFRTSRMAKVTLDAGQANYAPGNAGAYFTQVLERVRSLPGVESASVVAAMPLASFQRVSLAPSEGLAAGQEPTSVRSNSVDASYFDTMAIRIVGGRRFSANDDSSASRVAIVNDTFARQFWPGRNPIGRRLRVVESPDTVVEVVGVAETTTYHILGEVPDGAIYFPYLQRPRGQMTVLASTTGESAALIEPIRRAASAVDRDVPMFDADTVEHWYAVGSTGTLLSVVRLIGAMGVMGLMLSSVGLYGLVAYGVSRRTREFGIRLAIGATAARIVAMVLRQGTAPIWAGLTMGLLLSVVSTRALSALLPVHIKVDVRLYLIVVPLLTSIALLAAFIPARRAGRVNPITVLRDE